MIQYHSAISLNDGSGQTFDPEGFHSLGLARGIPVWRALKTQAISGSSTRLSGRDFAWMAAAVGAMLLVSFVLSYRRIFWEDEMLGWMLLRDPSWRHMVAAWEAGADGGGFFFYLSGRTWFALFGSSEVAFRFYSAMGFGLAFCVSWVMLRGFYARGAVAFALVNTWFFSPPLVTHMAEGRFYGLLMLGVTLAGWVLLKAQRTAGSPVWLCVLASASNGLLVTSHVLGVAYSGVLLLGWVALDLMERRRRLGLYGSVVLSWLLLVPERRAIEATMRVGRPHFWTTPPTLSRFVGAYTAFSAEVAVVLLVLTMLLFVSWRKSASGPAAAMAARRPAYVLTVALLLVPIAFTAAGLFGTSLFTSRYLMPVALAQAFVTAEAVTLIEWRALFGEWLVRWPVVWSALSVYVILLIAWVFWHVAGMVPQHVDYTKALTARFEKGVPVVCEDAWAFTELMGRQHDSGVRYVYLLDWLQSVAQSAPRVEVTEFHLMENWRKVGYFAGSIEPIDGFLRQHERFYLLHRDPPVVMNDADRIGNPLFTRFSEDPAYEVEPVGRRSAEGIQEAWLVCRGRCAAPGAAYVGPPPVK